MISGSLLLVRRFVFRSCGLLLIWRRSYIPAGSSFSLRRLSFLVLNFNFVDYD